MEIKNVLQEANDIVNGPRQEKYGPPEVCASNIAKVWTIYLQSRKDVTAEITAYDYCQMMILMKAIRQAWCFTRDNLVDQAGYSMVGEIVKNALDNAG